MRTEFKLPDLGENIDSGDIVKVLVAVGDEIKPEQPLLEIETGKAVVEVPSSSSGRIAAIHVEEGDKVSVGQVVLTIEDDLTAELTTTQNVEPPKPDVAVEPAKDKVPPSAITATAEPVVADGSWIPAAPGVKRLARELGVDLATVSGTGTGGRIRVDDVEAEAKRRPAPPSSPFLTPLPDFSRFGEIERKPMSNVRLTTARRMSQAWTTVPQVTQYDHADITDLDVLRKRYSEKVESMGGKLTITAVLLKVVASALRQFPMFNASVDMERLEIIYKSYVNVGVAVATERGLLVPVIKNADEKNILELAVELARASERAHRRQLGPAELEGGTFSITNLGIVGGTHFTPIVNWPEVAILGISRASTEPVFQKGEFVPRLILPLSLSYDHRLIDGVDGARFLRWICEALEQPFFLALEG